MGHVVDVYVAAQAEIKRCQREIEALKLRITAAKKRLNNPKYLGMHEAERIAQEAEPYQRAQLPSK